MSPRNNGYAKKLALEMLHRFLPGLILLVLQVHNPLPLSSICSMPIMKLLPPFLFRYITAVVVPRVYTFLFKCITSEIALGVLKACGPCGVCRS